MALWKTLTTMGAQVSIARLKLFQRQRTAELMQSIEQVPVRGKRLKSEGGARSASKSLLNKYVIAEPQNLHLHSSDWSLSC